MADSKVNVQPAATQAQPAAPLAVKVFAVPDAAALEVAVQAIAIVDVQGKPIEFLTEQTGQRILAMLKFIATQNAQNGADMPPDDI